jgi:hypothetical protein
MSIVIDEYGKWQVEEGVGCINRLMLAPTQKYLDENPQYENITITE